MMVLCRQEHTTSSARASHAPSTQTTAHTPAPPEACVRRGRSFVYPTARGPARCISSAENACRRRGAQHTQTFALPLLLSLPPSGRKGTLLSHLAPCSPPHQRAGTKWRPHACARDHPRRARPVCVRGGVITKIPSTSTHGLRTSAETPSSCAIAQDIGVSE